MSTLFRYGIVGFVNTALGVTIMMMLARLGYHYTVYTAAGYIIAFISSYILNGLFTFQVDRLSHHAFVVFVALNGALLLSVEGIQVLLIEYAGIRELEGVVLGAAAYTLTGYVLNKRIVYRVG